MPTYEYRCRDCGQHLEVVQSFADDPLTECPGCRGSLRKVFGAIGITFNGSGFYRTDSRSAPARGAASSAGSERSSAGSDGGSPAAGSDGAAASGSAAAKSA